MKNTVMVLLFILTLAGCTTMPSGNIGGKVELLVEAGFKKRVAQTAEQLTDLKTRPQQKLYSYKHEDGDLRFVYADAENCQCMYVGKQRAYNRLQQLTGEKNIADSRRIVLEQHYGPPINWALWGGMDANGL